MQLIDITPNDERWYIMDDLPNEIWKPIPECPTCYLCSNYSRIKTLPRNGVSRGGRILKPNLKKDGYYQVQLKAFGKSLYRRVNRVVGETFIPNPENKPLVDHVDNNPLNNKVTNLQWLTNAENSQKYAKEVYDGRYKGWGKIQPRKVMAKNETSVYIFDSIFKCSLALFGVKSKRGGISKACNTHKKYLGWYFKYYDEREEVAHE